MVPDSAVHLALKNQRPWIEINTDSIVLYNYRDANTASDVVAFFHNERLYPNRTRLRLVRNYAIDLRPKSEVLSKKAKELLSHQNYRRS